MFIAPVSANIDEIPIIIEENEHFIIIETEVSAVNISNINSLIQSKMWFGYSIKNILKTNQSTDYNLVIRSSTLAPGGKVTSDISYTFNTTITGVLSIQPEAFNIKINVSSFPSVTLASSNSYSCPISYAGKEVLSCSVTYHPKFQNYSFDEYFIGIHSGFGTARVLCGFTMLVQINTK